MTTLPRYTSEIRTLVTSDLSTPGPVPEVPVPGGPIRERIAQWREQRKTRKRATLCYPSQLSYRKGVPRGPSRVVSNEEYYALVLGHRLTISNLLMDLRDPELPEDLDVDGVEDLVLRQFHTTYQDLLLPPPVLDMLVKAARGKMADFFLDVLEEVRGELWDPTVGATALPLARRRCRLDIVHLGAEGTLAPGQIEALEFVTDVFLLQASARLDLAWAEHHRTTPAGEGMSRRDIIAERVRADESLFDKHLAEVARGLRYPGLPDAVSARIDDYLASRPDPSNKLLDPDWKPVLRRRRRVPGPDVPVPDVRTRFEWPTRVDQDPVQNAQVAEPNAGQRPAEPNKPAREDRSFAEIRASLATEIDRDELVDALSLAIFLSQRGDPSRILLTGPTGAGKTHAATAMARAAGVPVCVVSATDIVETGYRGMSVGDLLRPLYEQAGGVAGLTHAMLVIDEIDKIAMPTQLADTVGYAKRRGQQESLLGLVGGGTPVRISVGGSYEEIDTAGWMIVLMGAFHDASPAWTGVRPATTGDLIDYGLLPELAERIGYSLCLRPRSVPDLARLFADRKDGVKRLQEVYASLGYTLEVAEAAYGRVAWAVTAPGSRIGPRSGMAILVEAARRRLIHLLRTEAPAGTQVVVTPDDLIVPPSAEIDDEG